VAGFSAEELPVSKDTVRIAEKELMESISSPEEDILPASPSEDIQPLPVEEPKETYSIPLTGEVISPESPKKSNSIWLIGCLVAVLLFICLCCCVAVILAATTFSFLLPFFNY
jgi:hypothetical protein